MKVFAGMSKKAYETIKKSGFPSKSYFCTTKEKAKGYAHAGWSANKNKSIDENSGVVVEIDFDFDEDKMNWSPKKDEFKYDDKVPATAIKNTLKEEKQISNFKRVLEILREDQYKFRAELDISNSKWNAKRITGLLTKKFGKTEWTWSKMSDKLVLLASDKETLEKIVDRAKEIMKNDYNESLNV